MFRFFSVGGIGLAILGLAVACVTPPTPTPPAKPTFAPAATLSAPPSPGVPTPTAAPTPTREPVFVDESNCRDACHEPDPNELMFLGAKSRPADHKGYTTCLSCHATPAQPPLPATHLGRQDAACILCHLEP